MRKTAHSTSAQKPLRRFGDFSKFTQQVVERRNASVEISKCKKTSHWMWFIFPQLVRENTSEMSKFYGIKNLEEAKLFIANEHTGQFLIDMTHKVYLCLQKKQTLHDIFGEIDKLKFLSCMTLFFYATLDNRNQRINELFNFCKSHAEKEINEVDNFTIQQCEKEMSQRGGKLQNNKKFIKYLLKSL